MLSPDMCAHAAALALLTLWLSSCHANVNYFRTNEGLFDVPSDIFSNTTHIDLDTNNITEFPSSTLGTLGALTSLVLTNNKITTFPDLSLVGSTVTIVNLGYNLITCIPASRLDGLVLLNNFEIGHNPLVSFPESDLLLSPNLNFLGLMGTPLTYFPSLESRPAGSPSLLLFFMNTPFYCDCKVKWLVDADPAGRWFAMVPNPFCPAGPAPFLGQDVGSVNTSLMECPAGAPASQGGSFPIGDGMKHSVVLTIAQGSRMLGSTILSQHVVTSDVECALTCMLDPVNCKGYNYQVPPSAGGGHTCELVGESGCGGGSGPVGDPDYLYATPA